MNQSGLSSVIFLIKKSWSFSKANFIRQFVFQPIIASYKTLCNIFVSKLLINEISENCQLEKLFLYVSIIVVSNFMSDLIVRIFNKQSTIENTKFYYVLKTEILQKLIKIKYKYMETPGFLELKDKANNAVDSGYNFNVLYSSISTLISCSILLVFVFWILSTFSLLFFFLLLLITLIIFFVQNKNKKYEYMCNSEWLKINRYFAYPYKLIYDLSNGKTLRLFNAKKLLFEIADEYDSYMNSMRLNQASKQNGYAITIYVCNFLQQIFVYGFIAMKYLSSTLKIGDVLMYISASFSFFSSISNIFSSYSDIIESSRYIGDYESLFKFDDEINTQQNLLEWKHSIEFKNVSFHYPDQEEYVLRNFNMKINKGEKIALLGLNGSGKTTIIKLLLRLYDVEDGEIIIDGVNISNYNYQSYRRIFSCIFQDYKIYASSIKENLIFDNTYNIKDDEIDDYLVFFDLKYFIDSLFEKLDSSIGKMYGENNIEISGGQQQKIAIMRALLKKSNILIMDEPTASLDAVSENNIYNNIARLAENRTTIYISHRMSSCINADKIILLDNDHAIQEGTHDELIKDKKGKYYEMFQAQAKYY